MEFVKRKFLLLDIQGQITLGIFTVSLCVCILVFSLLTIYSFVFINLCYLDVISMIDLKENEGIEKVSYFLDSNLMVNAEVSKIGIQWLNNLIYNLERKEELSLHVEKFIFNQHFITPNKFSQESISNCNEMNLGCFFHMDLNQESEIKDSKFHQILYQTLPFLELLMNYKFVDKTFIPIFDKISIYSKKSNSTFFYPFNTKPNLKYNLNLFQGYSKNMMNLYMNQFKSISAESDSNEYLTEYNKLYTENKSLVEILETNPGMLFYVTDFNLNEYGLHSDKKSVDQTLGVRFLKNSQISFNSSIPEVLEKINYIISGEWAPLLTEATQHESYLQFHGIKAIYTNTIRGNENLSSYHICNYFRILYMQNNPLTNSSQVFSKLNLDSTIYDCFSNENAKLALDKLIKNPSWISDNYKRKVKFPFLNDYNNPSIDFFYKVFKYHFPDKFGLKVIQSEFMMLNHLYFYIFKKTKFVENMQKAIFNKFLQIMFVIIIYSTVIWVLILFIIFLLMKRVSKDITKPIQSLIKHVNNIGLISDTLIVNKSEILNLDDIFYKDDNDINDMFKICKELIRGGFNLKSNINLYENQKNSFLNSLNNLTVIKTNNLQIDESFIEKDYIQHVKNVFNFESQNVVSINKVKEVLFFQMDKEDNQSDNSVDDEGSLLMNDFLSARTKYSMIKRLSEDVSNFSDRTKKDKKNSKFSSSFSKPLVTDPSLTTNYPTLNLPTKFSMYLNLKDFIPISQIYSSKYSRHNFLYNYYNLIAVKVDNPYPLKYYNNNLNSNI